jgi:hypothetical protein
MQIDDGLCWCYGGGDVRRRGREEPTMFMRVARAGVDLQAAVAVRRLGEERLRPAFEHLPGFRSWLIGADAEQGRIISITLWETREQAVGVSGALADIAREYEALGVLFTAPEIYEVVE